MRARERHLQKGAVREDCHHADDHQDHKRHDHHIRHEHALAELLDCEALEQRRRRAQLVMLVHIDEVTLW